MMPVGFLLPEPIVPISDDETPRKFFRRLFHWFSNCTRWTRISVFVARFASRYIATTVLPNAVEADSTPRSFFNNAIAAFSCSGRSFP